MAMSKAEKAEMERLREERDLARALRWPEYARPEMIPAPGMDEATSGWLYNAFRTDSQSIYRAWSESASHGDGAERRPGITVSQRGIPLFATRRDALMALRLELTERFAKQLAEIDRQLASDPL